MDELIRFWIGFTLIAVSGIAAAIGWAIKNHQFSSSKRAENLPLESSIPDENEKINDRESED
jgi:nitrogen fixation-related uncharacterized protein